MISRFIYGLMFVCSTGSNRICLAAAGKILNLCPRLNAVLNRLEQTNLQLSDIPYISTAETVDTVETVEAVETVETVETERLKRLKRL